MQCLNCRQRTRGASTHLPRGGIPCSRCPCTAVVLKRCSEVCLRDVPLCRRSDQIPFGIGVLRLWAEHVSLIVIIYNRFPFECFQDVQWCNPQGAAMRGGDEGAATCAAANLVRALLFSATCTGSLPAEGQSGTVTAQSPVKKAH